MLSEKPIYNEKQKMEYIELENSKLNKEALKNYFARIYEYEKEYENDVADMNPYELKDTLERLGIRRDDTKGHLISLLRGYIGWAKLMEKTTNDSAIFRYSPESINSKSAITSQMIKSPEQLETILANSFERKNDDDELFLMPNRTARDMLVFWLLYSGMELEELCSLKTTDIDHHTITTKHRKSYLVNDKILSLWKECSNAIYIEKRNGKASKSKNPLDNEIVKYDLVENNFLFRPIRGKKEKGDESNLCFKPGAFASIILKVFERYSKVSGNKMRVSPLNIKHSGIFYKLYLLEKNEEITPKVVAKFFGIKCEPEDQLLLNTRKWRKDYENWKLAFEYM